MLIFYPSTAAEKTPEKPYFAYILNELDYFIEILSCTQSIC